MVESAATRDHGDLRAFFTHVIAPLGLIHNGHWYAKYRLSEA